MTAPRGVPWGAGLLGLAALTLLAGCSGAGGNLAPSLAPAGTPSGQPTSAGAPPPAATPAPPALVYAVDGSGIADVSYFVGTALSPVRNNVSLPWRLQLPDTEAPHAPGLTAQHLSGTGIIACTIYDRGVVADHHAAVGDQAVVSCQESRH